MSSLSPAQRAHLTQLYRRILRASNAAFANDSQTLTAWRAFAASRFRNADVDPAKYDEHVKHALEIEETLRKNVVQATFRPQTGAYALCFRPETELGSNDTIKQNRNKQIADLKNSKRPTLSCGGASGAAGTASSSQRATFSTFAALRAASSSGSSGSSPSSSSSGTSPAPRPIPTFPSLTILADGSSILLRSTSPRHAVRLTRDPTNHPLWNPALADRKLGAGAGEDGDGGEDAGGRLGRFRRRFDVGGAASAQGPPTESPTASTSAPSKASSQPSKPSGSTETSTSRPSSSSRRAASFGMDDLDWMSVGGRQARPGTDPTAKKGAAKRK